MAEIVLFLRALQQLFLIDREEKTGLLDSM